MEKKNDKLMIIIAGLVIGVIAAGLAFLGNPKHGILHRMLPA